MIDREELAAIKKRHEESTGFVPQSLWSSSELDRAALLDALEAAEARERKLREAAIELANMHRKKFRSDAVLLRRIDAALAETAP